MNVFGASWLQGLSCALIHYLYAWSAYCRQTKLIFRNSNKYWRLGLNLDGQIVRLINLRVLWSSAHWANCKHPWSRLCKQGKILFGTWPDPHERSRWFVSWTSGLSDRKNGDLLHSDFLTVKMLHKISNTIMFSQAKMSLASRGRHFGSKSLNAAESRHSLSVIPLLFIYDLKELATDYEVCLLRVIVV